uniref:Uncharacterized protein n=1 Tax=Anguilla anguilla TaxID=7936 RepID=A0A0E9SJH7_ANGAN
MQCACKNLCVQVSHSKHSSLTTSFYCLEQRNTS